MSRVGHYVRGTMQRRIFLWFGMSILLSGMVVAAVLSLTAPSHDYGRNFEQLRTFVGGRFSRVWKDPGARDELAWSIAHDLDSDVVVLDSQGHELLRTGAAIDRAMIDADVSDGSTIVGEVKIAPHRRRGGFLRIVLALTAAGAVLWAAAGRIARRISRPLDELVRVAEDLGSGKLGARARWAPRQGGGEVGLLACVINDMAARIERQMKDQRELLAAVSHEIRTPLARIRIILEMARDRGGLSGKDVDDIDREVIEIDQLVSELLASSRLQFSALTPKTLDAAEVAGAALERAGLSTDLLAVEGSSRDVDADPTLLARALANLIDNARRHGGGLDELHVVAGDERIRFEALDRGPGFAEGDEKHVFDAFVQRGSTQGALGLGLSLVKRIAEAHGGVAIAKNRADVKGACVAIELPKKPPRSSMVPSSRSSSRERPAAVA